MWLTLGLICGVPRQKRWDDGAWTITTQEITSRESSEDLSYSGHFGRFHAREDIWRTGHFCAAYLKGLTDDLRGLAPLPATVLLA